MEWVRRSRKEGEKSELAFLQPLSKKTSEQAKKKGVPVLRLQVTRWSSIGWSKQPFPLFHRRYGSHEQSRGPSRRRRGRGVGAGSATVEARAVVECSSNYRNAFFLSQSIPRKERRNRRQMARPRGGLPASPTSARRRKGVREHTLSRYAVNWRSARARETYLREGEAEREKKKTSKTFEKKRKV